MKLPSMIGGGSQSYRVRLKLLESLSLRLEGMSEQLLVFRRKAKEAEKERIKEKKARQREPQPSASSSAAPGDSGPSSSYSPSSLQLPLPRLAGELQGLRAHVILGADSVWCEGVEMEMATVSEALDALNFGAQDEEQEERDFEAAAAEGIPIDVIAARRIEREGEAAAMASLQDSVSAPFLRRHLAERALHVLEGVLCHLEDLSTTIKSSTTTTSSTTSSSGSGRGVDSHTTDSPRHMYVKQCLAGLAGGARALFSSLLKEMVRQRTEERDMQMQAGAAGAVGEQHGGSLIFPAAGAALFLTPKQVVVRGLLGCVRAQVLVSALQYGGVEEERMRALSDMLQIGFERSHIKKASRGAGGHSQLSALFPSFSASTASTLTAVSAPSLDVQAKSFATLFLAMHGSGDRGGERAEAPLCVALLAEVVGCMSRELQGKLRATVLKLCGEKLQK
jgi:hypothetical protein